jgi:7,8-dihydropterin-6-yl-methyl-4-(beta-D-ribofuranosyl)aminobenzene 5'-phosphate synthase
LSLHIQRDDDSILFDTGATGKFVANARNLGIDLKNVDVTAISHGHFDHSDGLRSFFDRNKNSPVYLPKHSNEDHIFKGFFFIKRDIGMDNTILKDYSTRLKIIDEFTEIARDVYLINDIKMNYPPPAGSKYLYVKRGSELVHDDFSHEQMMVIKEDDGLVIFTGCSHHGILNMVEVALKKFPDTPIKGLFGGFHFIGLPFFNHMAESKSVVAKVGIKLLDYNIKKVYTGHCTGRKAFPTLKKVMGNNVDYFATGNSVEI